jgi:cell division protein FtsW (lipid II flippase)
MMRAEAAVPLGRARFTELSLLLWVATFAITGFVAVLATETSSFKPTAAVVPVVFLALMLALHVFLVGIRFRGDQLLMPIAAGLTAIGLILVQRLASDLLLQQLSWSIIAAGAFAATIVVPRDLTALARFKWTWALLGLLLLMAPLLPVIGREINGARIWVKVGPGSIEPWEAVKILLVIFFAAYLEEYREVLSHSQRRIGPFPVPPVPYLVPIVAMWVIAMLVMVFEKDMGATVLFFGIFLAMRPFDEDLRFGTGYQLVQGLYALANGGLFGAGLGNGMPDRIPIVWSDFVFDAFAEEAGLAGALALLALYLVFLYRGMLIALRAPTMFLQLLAGGLSFIIALQTLVIVGGNLRLIPLTGITLPFVAYGGSSLVTNWMLVGILMRISQVSARMRGGGPP